MIQQAVKLSSDEIKHAVRLRFPQLTVRMDHGKSKAMLGLRCTYNKLTVLTPMPIEMTDADFDNLLRSISETFRDRGTVLLENTDIFNVIA